MLDATVTLYTIGSCGFYGDTGRVFGGAKGTFHDLNAWAKTLATIGESATYTPTQDDPTLRCFCIDIRELDKQDSFLIATWNELAHIEDGVQLLAVGSHIGDAKVSSVKVGAMNLPGYPAYFFIDASSNQVINFRFEQRLNGSSQFQRLVAGFLRAYSKWCTWDPKDPTNLIGYSASKGDPVADVEPLFSTNLFRRGYQADFIRENVGNIRRVVKRASVDPTIEAHKTFLDSSFEILGLPINNRLTAEIPFQYQFKTKLTTAKFDSIVSNYETDADHAWDDVGFVFARDSGKIHWLSGCIARRKWQLDVARSESGMVDVDELVDYINENIDKIKRALVKGK